MKETMDENMKKNQEFMLASQKLQVSAAVNLVVNKHMVYYFIP